MSEPLSLSRTDDVFLLTFTAGENRWNTTFVRQLNAALDEVERSTGPAALVTTADSPKFYSNGLDLAWIQDPAAHPEGGDREVFGDEFMTCMSRLITFPIPTLACINGHAFGAGFMAALCHDVRFARADRGFICANEMQLGLAIPKPELALFRHKLAANVFFETVQLAKRWTGPAALTAGIVEQIEEPDTLLPAALERAAALAPLGGNRELYRQQKELLYGEDAAINQRHGAAYMLRNLSEFY
ncbi:MAG: enoyl-CoA hydratase-related protein [Pseudomonadota bacterium]